MSTVSVLLQRILVPDAEEAGGVCRGLEFTLFSNRKNVETQEIFKLYNRIGELAVGSYGLIYLYDDEEKEKGNQFQFFSLSIGMVQELNDVYLSAIVPTIEDES